MAGGAGAWWHDWLPTTVNGTSLFHLSDRSEEYKARKEAFVSGLQGSTMEDVAFALAPVPVREEEGGGGAFDCMRCRNARVCPATAQLGLLLNRQCLSLATLLGAQPRLVSAACYARLPDTHDSPSPLPPLPSSCSGPSGSAWRGSLRSSCCPRC